MKLKIQTIKDPGIKEKERIVISVLADINLGDYLIAKTYSLKDERISAELEDTMWFPDQDLKQGDQVVVYTKAGEKNKITNSDGSTSYFYYWELSNPLGKEENAGAIIFEVNWDFEQAYTKPVKADEFDATQVK